MNLEQLIEDVKKTKATCEECWPCNNGELDSNIEAEDALLKFILAHADTLISWERQHALRTSPFDGDTE